MSYMNTRFIDRSFSIIGHDEKEALTKQKRECTTRALLVSLATGFMGFSTGFAVQVSARRALPGFVKRSYVIPTLMAAYVSSRTFLHMLENCQSNLTIPKKLKAIKSEPESADKMVMSSSSS